MYKPALGALALALSFGLVANIAYSQDQSQSTSGTPASTSGTPASTSATPASTPATPASTTAKPAPAQTLQDGVQNYGTTQVKTTTKTAIASPPGTSSKQPPAATGQAATGATTEKKRKEETVTVQESNKVKSTAKAWQTFEDVITLKPGQDQIPLSLVVTNAGYQGIKMMLNGSTLATEKNWKTAVLTLKMDDALAVGDNKLTIQAFGGPGATLTWKLTTPKAVITAIKPTTAASNEKVTISGRHFAKTAAGDLIQVGKKYATINSASAKEINVTLPEGLESGKTQVIVSVGGFPSKAFEIVIKGAPEVTGVDLISAPPGQAFTISGKGFSATASDNIVTLGGTPAPISSASTTSLNCTVPEMYFPQWNVPIVVKVGGVSSNDSIKLNIQSRVIPNQGVPEQ
jgi:IPT/TIG domain